MSLFESTRSNQEADTALSNCRFCASQMDQKELLDLSLDILFGKYMKMLKCLKLEVDLSDDKLPKHACLQCHNKSLEYFNFCLTVKRAQKTLNILYNVSKSEIIKNTEENDTKIESQVDSSHNSDLINHTEENDNKNIKIESQDVNNSINNCDSGINNLFEDTGKTFQSENNEDTTNSYENSEPTKNSKIEENLETNLVLTKDEILDNESCFTDDLFNDSQTQLNQVETDEINLINRSDDVRIVKTYSRKSRYIVVNQKPTFSNSNLENDELCKKPDNPINFLDGDKDKISKLKSKPEQQINNETPCQNNPQNVDNGSNIIKNIIVLNYSLQNQKRSEDKVQNSNTSQDKSKTSKIIAQNPDNTEKKTELTWKNVISNDTISWVNYPWYCEYCKEEFDSMEDVREHSKHMHSKCYGFKCADCKGDFNMFSIFVEHVRTHRDNLRLFCQYCNEQFENITECHQHSLTHWSSPICELCGEICPGESAMASHRSINKYRRKRLKKSTKKKVPRRVLDESSLTWTDYEWRCLDCFKIEPDIQCLRTHVREVHNKCFAMKCADCLAVTNDYSLFVKHVRKHRFYLQHHCEYCNQYFIDTDDLKAHVSHHLATENRCYGCGDSFQTRESLIEHILQHNAPREKKSFNENLTCNICSKTFTSFTIFKTHLRSHGVKEYKFICEICGKAFFYMTSYKMHFDRHLNDKDKTETCKICNKKYSSKILLKKHAKYHLTLKPFTCDYCQKSFKSKSQLRTHINIHKGVKPYACMVCNKKFVRKTGLRMHSMQHTGQRPYGCEICDKTFANISNCNKHMRRRHGRYFFKTKVTGFGRLEIDRDSGALKGVSMDAEAKEWLSTVTKRHRRKK